MKPAILFLFFSVFLSSVAFHSITLAKAPKILYVNSYHKGYRWSDDIEKGLFKALGVKMRDDGTLDISRSGIELQIVRMDTKLNPSERFKQNAALAAKTIIDTWQPDVVVASDDNASKYLIVPYFKNAAIPFVFCGVNWDASVYGFPVANVTGMVEVEAMNDTIAMLKLYSRGDRIGYLGSDEYTNRKVLPYHERILGISYSDGKLVSTFEEWKREYVRLQDTVDILICMNPIGISGWDPRQAIRFINTTTKIPSGCATDNTIQYVLLACTSIAEEQGWWAGKTALKILSGTPPADIPITRNKESRIYLNMHLAARLGIKFPMSLIEYATLVEELPESE